MIGQVDELAASRSFTKQAHAFILKVLGLGLAALVPYLTLRYTIPVALTNAQWLPAWALGVAAVFGIGGAAYWTMREEHIHSDKVQDLLQLVIRYFLAFIFVFYSFAKFYRTQFQVHHLLWQDTPLGDLSGFELTWLFFGYSYPYSVFIGLSQLTCSALLLFRRTWLIGALILLPIISNIVFVNFAYDIPVKLFSTIFLVMTIYLVLTELDRLIAFFLSPPGPNPLRVSARASYAWTSTLLILIVGFNVTRFDRTNNHSPSPPPDNSVHGIWEVTSFESDGEVLYQKPEPPSNWHELILEWRGVGNVAMLKMGGTSQWASFTANPADSTLQIEFSGNRSESFTGRYERTDNNRMLLSGMLGDDPVRIDLMLRRR